MHKSKIHCDDPDLPGGRFCYHTVRMTALEGAELAAHARQAGVSISKLIRQRSLGQRAPVAAAPELNRAAYAELARTAGNLNQLAHHLNQVQVAGQAQVIDLAQVRALLEKTIDQVGGLRADLIGASKR